MNEEHDFAHEADLRELRLEQLRMEGYEEFADEYDEETQELIRSYVNENQYVAFF